MLKSPSQVNSGASCTTKNLPWEELGTLEGWESYLVNHEDFASIGFPCPASTHSHSGLYQFTQKFTTPGASPLFKLLLNRQASSPVHSSPPPQGPQQHNPPTSPADTTRNKPEAPQTTRLALKKPCFTSTPTTLSSEVDIPQTALQQPPPAITPIPDLTPDSLEGARSATPDIPKTGDGGCALEVAVGAGGETPGATIDKGMASKQVQGKRKKAPAQRPPGSLKKLRSHLKTQGISSTLEYVTHVSHKYLLFADSPTPGSHALKFKERGLVRSRCRLSRFNGGPDYQINMFWSSYSYAKLEDRWVVKSALWSAQGYRMETI